MSPSRLSAVLILLCLTLALPVQAQNLVKNGDFEAGITDWTSWAAPVNAFWNGAWIQSNDCDIWVPTNGCPFAGTTSHAQKKGSGSGNAHGGLTQVLTVIPGRTYDVSGQWSGGVTGNLDANNGTWWEIVIYEGQVDDAIIDAGLRSEDTLVAKKEITNLAYSGVFQFQWEPFSGSFTAQTDTVTLVLKSGSFYTLDAAAYHDNIQVQAQAMPPATVVPVPLNSTWTLVMLTGLLALIGFRSFHRRG